jgi:predicted Zn-dependent protease
VADLEARISECRRRWEAAPDSRAFIPLADLLRQAGRAEQALEVLEAGLARHPRAVAALVTLARTLAAVGRTVEAAEAAAHVLEHDPDNIAGLELVAEEDRRRGDLVAASGRTERLAELAPDDRHWPALLGQLREQRAALSAAEGAAREGGFATLTLVDLYLAQGYAQKAEALLSRLVSERPDDPEVRRRLASLASAGDGAPAAVAPAGGAPRSLPQDRAERREMAKEQFAMWIERIRVDREVAP